MDLCKLKNHLFNQFLILKMGGLNVSTHPLIAHKMTILRDKNTSSADFRRVLKEITFYLGYEATRNLKLAIVEVNTSLNTTEGSKLAESISIIPILRAGTGMSETMLDLLPKASVHHIGSISFNLLAV